MTVKLRPTHVPERWRGYLSTEQIYEAEPLNASSGSYWVDSPRGPGGSPTRWLVLIDGCAHLDGHPWEVVEEERERSQPKERLKSGDRVEVMNGYGIGGVFTQPAYGTVRRIDSCGALWVRIDPDCGTHSDNVWCYHESHLRRLNGFRAALLGALVDAYRELVVREDSPAAIDHEAAFHEITGRIAERLADESLLEELERRIQSENPV